MGDIQVEVFGTRSIGGPASSRFPHAWTRSALDRRSATALRNASRTCEQSPRTYRFLTQPVLGQLLGEGGHKCKQCRLPAREALHVEARLILGQSPHFEARG